MDYTKITDNLEVIELLKKKTEIENKIKEIDPNALINHELELLGLSSVVQAKPERVCKGSWVFGNNCKTCKKCIETKPS